MLSSILLAENIALKWARHLINKGRPQAARRVLKLALSGPVLWSSRDQKAHCLQLYLSLCDTPTEALSRVEAFLSDREELSPLWEGLMEFERSRLLSRLKRESEAVEARSSAWQLLNRTEDNPTVFYPLAVLALALGFKSNAETFYRRSLGAGLERNRSRLGLALVTPDEQEARALLQGVIDSEESPELTAQARSLLASQVEDPGERLELLDQSLEDLEELDWITRTLRVSTLLKEGQNSLAEAELEELSQLPCEDPTLWGIALSDAGRWEQAWRTYRQQPPESEGVAILHINAAYRAGDHEAASQIAQSWLTQPIRDPETRLMLLTEAVNVWHGTCEPEPVTEFLKSHESLLGEKQQFLILQIEHHRLLGEIEQALLLCEHARAAGELAPEIRIWWSLGEFDKVRQGLEEIRAERGEDDLQCQALEAAALVTEERFDEALTAVEKVLTRIKEEESIHYYETLLALTEAACGKVEQASARLTDLEQRATQLTFGAVNIFYAWRAEVLLELKRPEEALLALAATERLVHPVDMSSYHYSRGRCYRDLGQLSEAKESLKLACESFPETLYARRARTLLEDLR